MWLLPFGFLVGVACILDGCAYDPVKAPPAGRADLLPVADYPQIVATQNLHHWLVFSPASITPGSDDVTMDVSVPMRSKFDKGGLSLHYRFKFFDDRGRPLREEPGWIFKHVEPRLQYHLEGNALDLAAVDWRLEIRAAR